MTPEPAIVVSIERCATCKHWEHLDYPFSRTAEPARWGLCGAIDGPYERDTPAPDARAFAQDASDYSAHLRTRDDFGCVLHEPKDPG